MLVLQSFDAFSTDVERPWWHSIVGAASLATITLAVRRNPGKPDRQFSRHGECVINTYLTGVSASILGDLLDVVSVGSRFLLMIGYVPTYPGKLLRPLAVVQRIEVA